MRMVEQEQAHRIEYETKGLTARIKDTARGHWIGGAISIAAIAGAVITALNNVHPSVSIALVGVPLFAAIQALIRSKSN